MKNGVNGPHPRTAPILLEGQQLYPESSASRRQTVVWSMTDDSNARATGKNLNPQG